ncbi:MAG: hypothetical protein ACLSE4_05330 [Clostridium sp.]
METVAMANAWIRWIMSLRQQDHPMLSWPEKTLAKLLFSPHIRRYPF